MERARIEEEQREKRDRDLKEMEMKSRMASLSAAQQQGVPGAFEAQIAEYQRRYGPQFPPHFALFPPGGRERLGLQMPPGAGGPESVHSQQMEQMRVENEQRLAGLNDPLGMYYVAAADHWSLTCCPTVRLQMANLASELQHHAHTHAHTHAHAHTHLHLHPHDAAMAGAPPGLESSGPSLHNPHPLSLSGSGVMRPPGMMPRSGDLMHASGLFRPPLLDEQLQVRFFCSVRLSHTLLSQFSLQQQQQQQEQMRLIMERDRALFGPGNPHF